MEDVLIVDLKELARWLKSRDSDNLMSNEVLDGLEELFELETRLAVYFRGEEEAQWLNIS